MELGTIFLAAFAGFCLLHFLVVSRIDGAWAANRGMAKVAKLGAISALKAARTVFQIATIVYGLLLLGPDRKLLDHAARRIEGEKA